MWEGRYILERHVARDGQKGLLRGAHILGERTLAMREEVTEDVVPGTKPHDVRPDRLDTPRHVEADPGIPRLA